MERSLRLIDDPRWEKASNLSRDEAAQALGEDVESALGLYVCAMREAFEEVGFLITETSARPERTAADDPGRFLTSCLSGGVSLDLARLSPAGRWVTPMGSPIRFDARFFLVEVDGGWAPEPDPSEVAAATWSSPTQALDLLARGEAIMAPPTVEMLQRLAKHDDVASAMITVTVGESAGGIFAARVSPLVQVVLAPNPGLMTGPGTNTYVVGENPALVIDPAVPDESYLDAVMDAAGSVDKIVVTHRHSDHTGGVRALAERSGAPVYSFGRAAIDELEVAGVSDGDSLDAGGTELRVLHTPGHAADHICLLLERAASLFAGDTVLGEGTPVIAPPDGDMRDYMATLRRLRELHIDRIYPGHWRPLDGGRAVIEGYLEHRTMRERAILDAVRNGAAAVEEIVERVYTDTSPQLHPVAQWQVSAHLGMLQEAGRVVYDGTAWRALD